MVTSIHLRSPSIEDQSNRQSRTRKPSVKTWRKLGAFGDWTSLSFPVPSERTTSGLVLVDHNLGHSHNARSTGSLWRNPPSWKEPREAMTAGLKRLLSVSYWLKATCRGPPVETSPHLRFPDERFVLDLTGPNVFIPFWSLAMCLYEHQCTYHSLCPCVCRCSLKIYMRHQREWWQWQLSSIQIPLPSSHRIVVDALQKRLSVRLPTVLHRSDHHSANSGNSRGVVRADRFPLPKKSRMSVSNTRIQLATSQCFTKSPRTITPPARV